MENIYNQIWASALKKLEIRSHSKAEIERKLMEKFPDDRGTVLKVLEELERVQLLNDRRFAEQFVEHLIQKPIGKMKIMIEVRRKGLDEDLVENLLLNLGWSEEEECQKALEQKEKLISEEDPRRRKQKLMNFLRSRGFRDAVIYKTI